MDDDDGKVRDVTTLDGIQEFVEEAKEGLSKVMFETHGVIPLTVIFATHSIKGSKLPHTQAMNVAPIGDWKLQKQAMRRAYLKLHAVGSLRVHTIGRQVVFQMEHSVFGDLVWYACGDDHHMLGKLFGPLPLAKVDAKRMNVMPQRYLN